MRVLHCTCNSLRKAHCRSSSLQRDTIKLYERTAVETWNTARVQSDVRHSSTAGALQMGLLDTLLRTEWDDRRDAGLFRYDVAACPSLMVPGAYGFIAQLNEGRASKKRPTEFRVDQVRVLLTCAALFRVCFQLALHKQHLHKQHHVASRIDCRTLCSSSGCVLVQVAQAFDGAKFNFTKALQKEVLVQFEPVLEKQPAYEAKVQLLLLPCNRC